MLLLVVSYSSVGYFAQISLLTNVKRKSNIANQTWPQAIAYIRLVGIFLFLPPLGCSELTYRRFLTVHIVLERDFLETLSLKE